MSSQYLVAPIALGEDGLFGSKNLSRFKPTHLMKARNISYVDGLVSMEGGSVKYNSTAISGAPTILGGAEWHPDSVLHRVIVYTSAGTILRDTGAGTFSTTMKSGLSTGVLPFFVAGGSNTASINKKLFIFNGSNPVQVIDGDATVTRDITSPPADWATSNQPTVGVIHDNRLWGAGNLNAPHRLYYSDASDHENLLTGTSGSMAVYSGEGDAIVALMSFKGYLIVWKKPVGVYLIDTTSPTVSNWGVRKLSNKVGTPNAYGPFQIDDEVLFMDVGLNIQAISSISETVDLRSRNISQIAELAPFMRSNINTNQLGFMQSVYYPNSREAHIALAGQGSTVNNRRLVIDFNRLDLPRFRFSDKDNNHSIWLDADINSTELFSGDGSGFVWKLDQSAKNVDGNPYISEFQTAYTDLSYIDPSYALVNKYGAFLEIIGESLGDWNIYVDVYWDGKKTSSASVNMGAGAALGTFILGTDKLSGGNLMQRKFRIVGGGRMVSLVFRSNIVNSDFAIAKAFLHYQLGDGALR